MHRAMKYPNRIRFLREQQGMTQTDLGRLVGLPQTHISTFEMGKRQLNQVWMAKFAKALGVHPADLIDQAAMVDVRDDLEALRGQGFGTVASLAARKGMRLYRVLSDSVAGAGADLAPGEIIGVDETANPRTGDIVLVSMRRPEDGSPSLMLWQYLEPGLIVTNRGANNVILHLDHPGLEIKILGVVMRGNNAN
jgi:transcriptional regulator with XRE-family HTH domain